MFDRIHDANHIALSAIGRQARIADAAYPLAVHLSQTCAMGDFRHIGQAIDLLRIRAGVSKQDLALETGMDPGNLNRIIKGKQWPTGDRLQALSEFFSVPVSEMFRIAEQGAIYEAVPPPPQEDPRKAALKALIDNLDDDQLAAAFRYRPDGDCEQAPAAPAPAAVPALPAPKRCTG